MRRARRAARRAEWVRAAAACGTRRGNALVAVRERVRRLRRDRCRERETRQQRPLDATASAADAPLVDVTRCSDTTNAHGATTRNNVSPHGRGANKREQSRGPHGPEQHRRDDAPARVDQSAVASASASPVVNGKERPDRRRCTTARSSCTPLRRVSRRRPILRIFMGDDTARRVDQRGTATAIGSLPHRDAHAAAALTLRCLPELPARAAAPVAHARAKVSSHSGPAPSGCRRARRRHDRDQSPRPRSARSVEADVRRRRARRVCSRSSTSPARSRAPRSTSRCNSPDR